MFAEMEAGLVSMVAQSALKTRLRELGTMPELEGEGLIKKMAADAPAVYVVAGQPVPANDGVLKVSFALACVARNARGHEDARRGDGKVIGMYQMMEAVIGLADNGRAGGYLWRVTGLEYMAEAVLWQNGLTVGVVTVETSASMPPALDEAALADLADFATLRTDYDIPQHVSATEHGKWAGDPQDISTTAPELQDTIQLQP